ncbi:hypothetical protein D3C72_2459390 [compost metagenome]
MQTARPALPELDTLGQQAIATPVFGAMRLGIGEPRFGGLDQTLQFLAAANYPALR